MGAKNGFGAWKCWSIRGTQIPMYVVQPCYNDGVCGQYSLWNVTQAARRKQTVGGDGLGAIDEEHGEGGLQGPVLERVVAYHPSQLGAFCTHALQPFEPILANGDSGMGQ